MRSLTLIPLTLVCLALLMWAATGCDTREGDETGQTTGDSTVDATGDVQEQAIDENLDGAPDTNAPDIEVDGDVGGLAQPEPMVEMEESPAMAPSGSSRAMSMEMADDMGGGYYNEPEDREQYAEIEQNPVQRVSEAPVSTFSIDVDTGAYSNVRRMLQNGGLPRKDAVRVEEMINYFTYDYPGPETRDTPFHVTTEIAPTPWNPDTLLLMIGIKGYDIESAERPAANLVFLLDVSGSMDEPDKLPLLKSAFSLLTSQLTERDRVSIVVYAGAAGVVLEPTPGNDEATILSALNRLSAGGSTAGGEGIQLAYAMARQAFVQDGINRILLATDGDFNVGTTNFEALLDMVERERESGVSLTTLGFGEGNYNEQLMEQMADAGNGNYAYIDTLNEANKVLVTEITSTLFTIAKDVKIQIEFNPDVVAEYRQIGYENRQLREEDFNNDTVDAGDIGAGHTVTALYEIALVGSGGERLEPHRYGDQPVETESEFANELAFLKLRYKLPDSDTSTLMETPLTRDQILASNEQASMNFHWASAVAAFAELLRDGAYTGDWTWDDVLALARSARGEDPFGYRGEFLSLVNLAKSLAAGDAPASSSGI